MFRHAVLERRVCSESEEFQYWELSRFLDTVDITLIVLPSLKLYLITNLLSFGSVCV